MRLNVCVVGAEESLGTVASQVLGNVNGLAATVVALARVALGIFVGEHRTLRLEHAARNKVFARDHLECVALAIELCGQNGCDLWVGFAQRLVKSRRQFAVFRHGFGLLKDP